MSSPFERNRDPILAVLRRVLAPDARVLELASGSGQHACYFARAMPGVRWQPSDVSLEGARLIAEMIARDNAANLAPPLVIDACAETWAVEASPFDAVVAINMIHISPWEATLGLMGGAARVLKPDGVLYTYGPYMRDGRHTAPSNETFDASLKARNAAWGVRDVAEVASAGEAHGLILREIVEMPANNLSLVFRYRDVSSS